jgi:hypothetical protein
MTFDIYVRTWFITTFNSTQWDLEKTSNVDHYLVACNISEVPCQDLVI